MPSLIKIFRLPPTLGADHSYNIRQKWHVEEVNVSYKKNINNKLKYACTILSALLINMITVLPTYSQDTNAKQTSSMIEALRSVFYKEEFYRSFFIVLLTALIGGIVVNIVKGRLDDRSTNYKKLLGQKTDFLKEFSETVWEFHFAVVKVSFCYAECQSQEVPNQKCAKIYENYEEVSWNIIEKMRKMLSNAEMFPDVAVRTTVKELYKEIIVKELKIRTDFEKPIISRRELTEERDDINWARRHHELHTEEWPPELDSMISRLATSLKLRRSE